MNASLSPEILRWVRVRAQLSVADLASKLRVPEKAVEGWERTGQIEEQLVPTLAEKTKTEFGYLFLDTPPDEHLPISDFRTVAGSQSPAPSRALLSVLYRCQRRQQWYREYLIASDASPLSFVGSKSVKDDPSNVAREITAVTKLGYFSGNERVKWEDAMSRAIEGIESAGIIVNKVGYAGYTRNTLSVEEFRGFALSDPYAPLVFVNGADAPAAQMFTLAHELVHIWIGNSAVSNLEKTYSGTDAVEKFCNEVAAEILVPMSVLKRDWNTSSPLGKEVTRLARQYGVSKIVIARRGKDAGIVSPSYYTKVYRAQIQARKKSEGGKYYTNKAYEASRRFSGAVIREARNGKTMFREAMDLLGLKKFSSFERYAEKLQIGI